MMIEETPKILKTKDHSILTNSQAAAIREFKKSNVGYTGRQLSHMFDVNETVISKVLREETYKKRYKK